jgi:LacI family transcriptional regulator
MTKNKEITIYDIAQKLNISPATVSRGLKDHPAINGKTKKKITDMARELGYRSNTFASNLRNKRTNTIGVIVPRLNSSFMSDVIAGIEKVVNEAGYNLIISQSLESAEKEVINAATMFNNRVDGLLVSLAYNADKTEHFEPFIRKEIPLIFFDRVVELQNCSTIVIDNYKAAFDVTSHLLEQGCKNLFHITGNLSRNVYRDRFNGFVQAIKDHSLSFESENLLITDLSPDAGTQAALHLIAMKNKPDGIFVANDLCAASCMLQLKKDHIRIPDDMLFAGFNNDIISKIVEPNLTTIDYKGFEMGEISAQTLINQLNKNQTQNLTQSIVIRHELIIRQSSQRTKLI